VAIAAGGGHCLALKADGSLVSWGYDAFRQVTLPVAAQSAVKAIAAGSDFSLALKTDGTVVAWGDNTYGQTALPVGLQSVTSVTAGSQHAVALRSDGTVISWGYSSSGKLTVPLGLTNVTAIEAGRDHTVALVGTAQPIVTHSLSGNELIVHWPEAQPSFRVQSSQNMSTQAVWSIESGTFQTNNGLISVALPISGPRKFYRLIKP
jgi:alpha-tubulin suppressor-like RCC1 family protein